MVFVFVTVRSCISHFERNPPPSPSPSSPPPPLPSTSPPLVVAMHFLRVYPHVFFPLWLFLFNFCSLLRFVEKCQQLIEQMFWLIYRHSRPRQPQAFWSCVRMLSGRMKRRCIIEWKCYAVKLSIKVRRNSILGTEAHHKKIIIENWSKLATLKSSDRRCIRAMTTNKSPFTRVSTPQD